MYCKNLNFGGSQNLFVHNPVLPAGVVALTSEGRRTGEGGEVTERPCQLHGRDARALESESSLFELGSARASHSNSDRGS